MERGAFVKIFEPEFSMEIYRPGSPSTKMIGVQFRQSVCISVSTIFLPL